MESPIKQYVPVEVGESPLSKQGNLTGNPRKVCDLAADLFNSIQEWNRQQESGLSILYSIMNMKTQQFLDHQKENNIETYPPGLQELCDQLSTVCNVMVSISDEIEKISLQFASLCKLETLRRSQEKPIILTWPVQEYVSVSEMVNRAYKKEMKVKLTVKEYVAHSMSKEELMTYLATWVYQPYIDNEIDFKIEAMLKETGHR